MKESDFRESPASDKADYRFNQNGLQVFGRVRDRDNELIGMTYIHSSLKEMYSRLWQDIGGVGAVLLVASILAWLVSARLQRMISPVLELSATARAVSEKKDYS